MTKKSKADKVLREFLVDIDKVANRETDLGWFNGQPGPDKMLYHEVEKKVNQNFVFTIVKKLSATKYEILSRNKMTMDDKYEILSQKHKDIMPVKILNILVDNKPVKFINTPLTKAVIEFTKPINLVANDIGRIKCKP